MGRLGGGGLSGVVAPLLPCRRRERGESMRGGAAAPVGAAAGDRLRSALVAAAVVALLAVVADAAAGAGTPTTASASTPVAAPARYDLALGDSLAAGVGATSPADGYVARLYRAARATEPGLRLVDLACPGATSTSFALGGGCAYPEGSQLAEAEAFLRGHREQVAFVTIDVGINDVDSCMSLDTVDTGCVSDGLRTVSAGIGRIVAGLRKADPTVVVAGSDYYDPFLAAWSDGPEGASVARASETAILALDEVLTQAYDEAGVGVAAVAARFDTSDTRPGGTGDGTPENVARVCQWTSMCSSGNLHPNDAGHAQIAAAFERLLGPRQLTGARRRPGEPSG